LSRVLPEQIKHISFKDGSRYVPVKAIEGGIVVMIDNQPGEPEELIQVKSPQGNRIIAMGTLFVVQPCT
jgi:26S proteasome regulatory subunit N2